MSKNKIKIYRKTSANTADEILFLTTASVVDMDGFQKYSDAAIAGTIPDISDATNVRDAFKYLDGTTRKALAGKVAPSDITTGTTDGTIKVGNTEVAVHGLASGAYAAAYSHPTTSGNKHIPSGGAAGEILRWSADGTAVWGADSTYSDFIGSGATAAHGLVPKPPTTAGTTKYLREDGSWQVPPNDNTTYSDFVGSGESAASGLVPKPSTTAGTTKYLREDGSWQVPPNDNTTYTGSDGVTLTGTNFTNSGVRSISTGATDGTISVNTNGTAAEVAVYGLASGAFAEAYTHPTSAGNKHIPAGGSSGKILKWSAAGTASWEDETDTTYSDFVGSGASAAAGLVPKPSTTAGTTKYLREDGSWQVPPDHTYSDFVGSGSGAAAGLVPAPSTTAGTTKYLREDGSWNVPYTHPTSAGNKHIPSGGSTGKVLTYGGSSGTAAWDDLPSHEHTVSNITDFPTIPTITDTYDGTSANGMSGKAVKSAIDSALTSAYKPSGSIAFASLPTLAVGVMGNVYNITDSFTIDNRFVEYDSSKTQTFPAGTEVAVINTGSSASPTYKFSVMSGFIDLSGYQATDTAVTHTKDTAAGSATQPVYVDASGVATACTYTLGKSVPSDAVFTDTTYSEFVKSGSGAAAGLVPAPSTTAGTTKYLREDGTWEVPYTHPTTAGNKHIPAGGSSGKILKWSAAGTASWEDETDTTYSDFVGSGATAASGLVPKPSTTAGATKYLREDGSWEVPPDHTYSNFVGSGESAAAGLVPTPPSTAGTTKYLREDGNWEVPYTHPTTAGNKHIPAGGSSGKILKWSSAGTASWEDETDTTYSDFVGSGASAASGLVPAPSTTAGTTKYLREDGTWEVPPNDNTTYTGSDGVTLTGTNFTNSGVRSVATGATNGTISVNTNGTAEEVSVYGLASGAFAEAYSHPTTAGNKHIPAGGSSGQILKWNADGTAVWAAEYSYTHPTTSGNKHIPSGGSSGQILKYSADGTAAWAEEYSYTHPTTAGNKHIPAGGSSGQILKYSADGTAEWANEYSYTHPTTSGNKHIPSGGSAGQILKYSADGTAEWANETDEKVNVTLATTTKAYLLATSTAPTATAAGVSAVGDTGVYLGTTAGELVATKFTGALSGNVTGNCSGSSGSCTGNAGTATTLETARTIDGVSFNGSANITHFGECSTAAATAAKTVSCTGFTLATGARITVKFTNANTAASATLNVNSTGAKAIYYRGSALQAGAINAGIVADFVYDGTYYQLIGNWDTWVTDETVS